MTLSLLIVLVMFTLRSRAMPDRQVLAARMKGPVVTALDMHLSLRDVLPAASLGMAGNTALAMAILHFFGVPQAEKDLAAVMITSLGALFTAMLSRVSLNCAGYLVAAENGAPDHEKRKGLIDELVIYPLLPLGSAFALTL